MSAAALAEAVRTRRRSAVETVEAALAAFRTRDGSLNTATRLLTDRALSRAAKIDAVVAAGGDPGPLAGVPFGVKDLFDVEGLPTTAGAGHRRGARPALRDAEAVRRLEAAGAVLTATLNMDAFAYGFATVNADFGVTRNPHDPDRLAGGSSGGSAAAVAAGLAPLSLGSDTNGSIRVPAALCGVWGLRPTQGALPMAGVFPFVASLDTIGPFANSAEDLALAWRVLAGADAAPAPADRPLRVARLGEWFAQDLDPALEAALARLSDALGADSAEAPLAAAARSAAFVTTAAEGGALHLPQLRRRALDYDPAVRDRLLAGAALPYAAYADAQRLRAAFGAEMGALFERCDVLLAPAAPGPAPRIDEPTVTWRGAAAPARTHLGVFAQPVSFAGVPVIAAPLPTAGLPLGVQLIGPPGGEARLLAWAAGLERAGLLGRSPPGTWA